MIYDTKETYISFRFSNGGRSIRTNRRENGKMS
jgi:hypothetical protein